MSEPLETSNVLDQIDECLDVKNPKSFFLFAGAGTGKTRTLVEVLKRFREERGLALRRQARYVAVITYTNAACDEIRSRLEFDATFHVSTIHSFSWELIRTYTKDIREWVRENLHLEIADLEEKQSRGRPSAASDNRERQIAAKTKRLAHLDSVVRFTYNPNGENTGRDALSHAEVIKITASFLAHRSVMKRLFVRKFPILLVDESQDTQKDLMEAFLLVQAEHSASFALGLFGDTMQRIYADGKVDLGVDVPDTWAKPALTVNYRCPRRVLELINAVRRDVDGRSQECPPGARDGHVRLFLLPSPSEDQKQLESEVASKMASITGDELWEDQQSEIKTLTLEHHMAARRGGFSGFFVPLYRYDRFRTGLLDGTLSGIPFLARTVVPLVHAVQTEDKFAVARIVREHSPLMTSRRLSESQNPSELLNEANSAVQRLSQLWDTVNSPALREIICEVMRSGLFDVPEVLRLAVDSHENTDSAEISDAETEGEETGIEAWRMALSSEFTELGTYVDYISDKSRFGTHQGIKGLEFPRVMVIIDDSEARGFLFKYEKLLGAAAASATDRRNAAEKRETTIDRTKRLFYVTCSRARESLAVVVYSENPSAVREHVVSEGWFKSDEIIEIGDG